MFDGECRSGVPPETTLKPGFTAYRSYCEAALKGGLATCQLLRDEMYEALVECRPRIVEMRTF